MAKRKRFGRVMAPALLLPLGFAPLAAYALGLGNLRVDSALGQPLSARIELIGATPAQAELATVGLASAQAHQRLGIDSSLGGVALRFVVKVGSNGKSYVSVSSHQPVREPFIDFVVQAVSPTGQVARHYTILLDPVGSTAAPTAAASTGWSPLVTPIPERATAPRPRVNPFANAGAPKAGAMYGPVPPGATLWAIARRVRPGGTDLDAVMSTIVRANPQAFINGDPARLKAGSRLTIPDAQALRATMAAQAPPVQDAPLVDATPAATPAPPAPPAPQPQAAVEVDAIQAPDAEVRVLRSEDAKSATSPASSPDASAGGNRVQLLEEALDAAQQQNESLQQRMGSLEQQIRTLTDLVKASPAEQVSEGAAAQSASTALSAPASPAIEAATAPVPAQSEPTGGPSSYLLAAVVGLGLGGLLLWARRRKAAVQPISMFDEPAAGAGAVAASKPAADGIVATSATQVEWVESVVAQPVPVEVPAVTQAPAEDGFGDPVDTQIDLLTAYVGMADGPSARQIYDEIQRAGTPAQKAQAAALLARLDA